MALLLVIVFGTVMTWLRFYTNHGQQLKLKNYKGEHYEEARKDEGKKSFELIVKDSVHIVGQPGGIIIAQNPTGGALLKENRKVYVDVTKYKADVYNLSDISAMYGNAFDTTIRELEALKVAHNILGYKYDSGEPNHILEVRYKGEVIDGPSGRKLGVKIEKGATLEFVLSKEEGGKVSLPNLLCKPYGELDFILEMHNLVQGDVIYSGPISDKSQAYIIAQYPFFTEGVKINTGQEIQITIQQKKPESCEFRR